MRKLPLAKALTVSATGLVALLVAVTAGWLTDDVWLGEDLPRGVSIAGVDVSRLSRADASSRLAEAGLDQRRIELHWAGLTADAGAAEVGVVVGYENALVEASDRGSVWGRPYRWLGSLLGESSHEPSYDLDPGVLAAFFDSGAGTLFELDFGHPEIELVGGKFVEIDPPMLPVVDIDALRSEILAAAAERIDEPAVIQVPVAQVDELDRGVDAVIAKAYGVTEGGLGVRLANDYRSYRIPENLLREWIVFDFTGDQPAIGVDDKLVMTWLRRRFDDTALQGETVEFLVSGFTDSVYLTGGTASMACCELAAADDIAAALHDGSDLVIVRPVEDPTAEGSLAWAESLGITELVGKFTTYFEPGQSRVTNIARISDLTRGVVIAPGETFSVNDYVGRRTRANGFVAAGMISDGVFIDSVGGGISQYATTLFNAAFFAGLDFGEYQSHSIYLSRYPYGREATVSFPRPDLQIVNNTPYGVLIWPTTTDDSITVKLFSTRWATGEQTGQSSVGVGRACTKVTTERTRTFVADQRTEVDYVTALYRPTGIRCDGSSSVPTTSTTTTTRAVLDTGTTDTGLTDTGSASSTTSTPATPSTAPSTTAGPPATTTSAVPAATTSTPAPSAVTSSAAPTTTAAGEQGARQ